MATVKELHQQAMDLLHENKLEEAFTLACRAAAIVPCAKETEPTRSILYQSAASIAFRLKRKDEARKLISEALEGFPSPQWKASLLWLLETVNIELLPCPFCGGEANAHDYYEFGGLSFGVTCSECEVTNQERDFHVRSDAVAAWNTRITNPKAGQEAHGTE